MDQQGFTTEGIVCKLREVELDLSRVSSSLRIS